MGGGQSSGSGSGFRVFKICPKSPAERAGLEVFFDYIVEVEGQSLLDENEDNQIVFFSIVQKSIDQQIKLLVFNARTRSARDVWVIPSHWGGVGLLGATVRYDSLENAFIQGVRVLDVSPNSPAGVAGLIPYNDFILGTQETLLSELDELVEVVNAAINDVVLLTVYNSETETIREVALHPNEKWGGKGCIGCDIGTGYIHRIPPAQNVETARDEAAREHQREVVKDAAVSESATFHPSTLEPPPLREGRCLETTVEPHLSNSSPEAVDHIRHPPPEDLECVEPAQLDRVGGLGVAHSPLITAARVDDSSLVSKIQEQLRMSEQIISTHSPCKQTISAGANSNNISVPPPPPLASPPPVHESESLHHNERLTKSSRSDNVLLCGNPSNNVSGSNAVFSGGPLPPPGLLPPFDGISSYFGPIDSSCFSGVTDDEFNPPRPGILCNSSSVANHQGSQFVANHHSSPFVSQPAAH